MPLQRLSWRYSRLYDREATFLPSTFMEWHRARKMRLELEALAVDGRLVGPAALDRLNFWISANGSWNCTLLSHFECERVLTGVLDQGGLMRIGSAGAGRWPSSATFKEVLGDGGESVQAALVFEVSETAEDKRRKRILGEMRAAGDFVQFP